MTPYEEVFSIKPVDFIFLDLEMPGMTGIQVIRDLRKYLKDQNIELEK